MSYTKRVLRSDELFNEGDRITVMIKEIRADERRLLLSVKDAAGDPWALAQVKFVEGTVVRGRVERREAYGLFVKLDEGIVGLLPKSKANENPEFPFEKVKIGDEITVQVAELRLSERRISLGLPKDPDAEAWKGFMPSGQTSKSMGTLGDQFKTMFGGAAEKKK
jgi:small subunit ribosomal protein S1